MGRLERSACCAALLHWTSSVLLQRCCGRGRLASVISEYVDRSGGSERYLCYLMNGARELPALLVARLEDYERCCGSAQLEPMDAETRAGKDASGEVPGWVLRCDFVLNVPAGRVSPVQLLATGDAVLGEVDWPFAFG